MRRWWLAIALLLSLGVNVGVLATLGVQHFRRPGPGPLDEPGGPPPHLLGLADRLGIEAAERDRFLAVERRFFRTVAEQRSELERLHGELRRELTSEHPDRERIDRLTGDLGRTYAALDRAFADNVLACREILTPEQQRRFFALLGRLRQGPGPGAGPRPLRRPGRPFQ